TWSREARRLYSEITASEIIGPVNLLTVGVSPRPEALGGAVAVVTVFRSPDFTPEIIVGGNRAVSIGSGAQVEKYRKALEHLFQAEDVGFLQAEVGSPSGFGRVVANMINREATLNPVAGISPHFHYCCVQLGRIEVLTPNGMPEVATNWPELLMKIGDG